MILSGTRASLILFVGDLTTFILALVATLFVRYGGHLTSFIWRQHLYPFLALFALWALVFYLSGLYGKRIIYLKSNLANALVKTQAANIILAALFFFLFPVGIAPKTNLLIYLVISLALILAWRLGIAPRLSSGSRINVALVGEGGEVEELVREVQQNRRYGLDFKVVKAVGEIEPGSFERELEREKVGLIIVDTSRPIPPELAALIYKLTRLAHRAQFAKFEEAYEEVFDRVPLSRLAHDWFLQKVGSGNSALYALGKRAIDIVGGILMGIVTVVALPFVALALQFEYPGSVFSRQERIGQGWTRMRSYKFRTMRYGDRAAWSGEDENVVSRVGSFLRKTSLDEFPQFINVLRGELSLIGPRNDMRALGERLQEALPYYEARYMVKPGITGWAQVNQQYEPGNVSPQSIEETKVRLAYDFYYLKHRSLGLDLVIALKTLKRMFFRVSSW